MELLSFVIAEILKIVITLEEYWQIFSLVGWDLVNSVENVYIKTKTKRLVEVY